jgi:hypothetical protein
MVSLDWADLQFGNNALSYLHLPMAHESEAVCTEACDPPSIPILTRGQSRAAVEINLNDHQQEPERISGIANQTIVPGVNLRFDSDDAK